MLNIRLSGVVATLRRFRLKSDSRDGVGLLPTDGDNPGDEQDNFPVEEQRVSGDYATQFCPIRMLFNFSPSYALIPGSQSAGGRSMPRQLMLSHVPVDLSIVEFNLDAGEDVFLTYTWERREGPEIRRTGKGPPYMDLIGGQPGKTVVDAFGLRLGTWLIQEDLRGEECNEAQKALEHAQRHQVPQEELDVLRRTLDELKPQGIRAHDTVFTGMYPGYEIVGHQGCGDLTMNYWNVAYLNSDLGQDDGLGEHPPTLVGLPQEPLESRTYPCIVKWKGSEVGLRRLSIEEVQFHRRTQVRNTNEMAWVRYGGNSLPRGDRIEFAVSNQQVIRSGKVVPIVTSCHQFSDLRHLLQMPNLNPKESLDPREPRKRNGEFRPREIFNERQFGDIWFGEFAFLEDKSLNLLRAALAGPVLLDPPPGANEQLLRGAFALANYKETRSLLEPLSPGRWRFVKRSPHETLVEIFFKRNTYGWTMIGLSLDSRRIFCLACTGKPGVSGYVLEEAAEILLRAGAWNALLIDEGADVFQKIRFDDNELRDLVPRLRRRLRATFVFARPRQGLGCVLRPPATEERGEASSVCEPRGAADHTKEGSPPRNQAREPSCVGFASAAAREYVLVDPELLSPRFLYYWCKEKDGRGDVEGTFLWTAERVLRDKGICREIICPYDSPHRTPPKASETDAARFRTEAFVRLYHSNPATMLRNMKCWLDQHGPFVAGVWVYQGWRRAAAEGTGRISLPADMEPRLGGHAICIVGYNDAEGYFVFKNSWGTDWGDRGYGYLPYEYAKNYCLEAWGLGAAPVGRDRDSSVSSDLGDGSNYNATA